MRTYEREVQGVLLDIIHPGRKKHGLEICAVTKSAVLLVVFITSKVSFKRNISRKRQLSKYLEIK